MINHKAQAVIWDLDETIIRSGELFATILGTVIPQFNLVMPTAGKIRENFHGPLEAAIKGSLEIDDELTELVHAMYQQAEEMNDYYEDIQPYMYDDAYSLLQRIASTNMTQILVTNRIHRHGWQGSPHRITEKMPLTGLFAHVICGNDVKHVELEGEYHRKPDPKVVEGLLNQLGLKPDKLVIVGDQFVDAQLALALKCKAILVSRQSLEPPHMDKLDAFQANWRDHVSIVSSLDDVTITKLAV